MKSNNDCSLNFCKKLEACVEEYKKQTRETYDEADAAHFYDKKLKEWINKHYDEITILSRIGLHKGFISFITHSLFNDEESSEEE